MIIATSLQVRELRQERLTNLSVKSLVTQLIRHGLECRHSGLGIPLVIGSVMYLTEYDKN